MDLKQALGVLSKSSKYSVSTLRTENAVDELQSLKDYLYIIPDIQTDFEMAIDTALSQSNTNCTICLCGSSGDGKSEILTKLFSKFCKVVDFHLDATHSNSQHKSAVECLDERFDKFKDSNKPLAVGINIGMLQKFIKQGSDRHNDIKHSFEEYFENRHIKGYKHQNAVFFDFECYPRLNFSDHKITSSFISEFLGRLTEATSNNPFYKYYLSETQTGSYISKNFEVLSLPSFQAQLVELFGLARLLEEQFLIPRIFVDFIYQILTKEHDDGIIGNVFSEFDNEFSLCFRKIDPINFRSRELDDFYLEYSTHTLSEDIANDINRLRTLTRHDLSPEGVVRSSYLLQGHTLTSSLSNFYEKSDIQKSLKYYLRLINIYKKSELSSQDEDDCLNILEELIVSSAITYANRALPSKADGFIVSRKLANYSVCNRVNIQADIDWIEDYELISTDTIPIPLIINDEPVFIFNIDLNTIIQAVYISNGYRPNRQNIEAVAKFDELIRHVVEHTHEAESLKLINNDKTVSINKNRRRYTVEV